MRQAGADVEVQVFPAGHALTEQNRDLAADWLSRHVS